jgi:septum formation protein
MSSLLLASGSPQRSELLAAAGFEFETITPGVAEKADPHLTARELTSWNAVRKGLAVARDYANWVVLAADTVVSLDGEIIGKPADFADAVRILSRLNGRIHCVYSSVVIAQLAAAKVTLFSEMSEVRFRTLSERQIRDYLTKINPLDKAGAYAAQGYGAEIIDHIDGSYSNVVGLPMERTIEILKQFGVIASIKVNRRSPSPGALPDAPAGVPDVKRGKETKR